MIKLEKKIKMKIIQSATILFSTRGVRNTTVDEIAKTAKVGKGTIYYYYTDKTEILCDCYMRHIQLKRSQLFNLYKEEKMFYLEYKNSSLYQPRISSRSVCFYTLSRI